MFVPEHIIKYFQQPEIRLYNAILDDDVESVIKLFDQNINPNFEPELGGKTLLKAAILKNNPEIVEIILQNEADPNFSGNMPYLPLTEAIISRNSIKRITTEVPGWIVSELFKNLKIITILPFLVYHFCLAQMSQTKMICIMVLILIL